MPIAAMPDPRLFLVGWPINSLAASCKLVAEVAPRNGAAADAAWEPSMRHPDKPKSRCGIVLQHNEIGLENNCCSRHRLAIYTYVGSKAVWLSPRMPAAMGLGELVGLISFQEDTQGGV